MNLRVLSGLCFSLALAINQSSSAQESASATFLGFDRNDYPGDANLTLLRRTFSFTGYWLNNPPGARANTWAGKRHALESANFGFLVLFNGRLYKELKHTAATTGEADGRAAASTARREGFPSRTIIFLDIEEGGRMLPEQKAYIYAIRARRQLARLRALRGRVVGAVRRLLGR